MRCGSTIGALEAIGLDPAAALRFLEPQSELMARLEDARVRHYPEYVRGEIARRGLEGVVRPVVSGGRVVCEAIEYDSKLTEMEARATDPARYGSPKGADEQGGAARGPLIVFNAIVPASSAVLPTLASAVQALEGGVAVRAGRELEAGREAVDARALAYEPPHAAAGSHPTGPSEESHPSPCAGPILPEAV